MPDNGTLKRSGVEKPNKKLKLPVKRRLGELSAVSKTNRILFILLVLAVVASVFFYNQNRRNQDKLKHPEVAVTEKAKSLANKVSRLAVLPNNEVPIVVDVTDASKLSNQTFFTHAKNGDEVLVYQKAQIAVLYRPGDNKIVNIASPSNISQNSANQ